MTAIRYSASSGTVPATGNRREGGDLHGAGGATYLLDGRHLADVGEFPGPAAVSLRRSDGQDLGRQYLEDGSHPGSARGDRKWVRPGTGANEAGHATVQTNILYETFDVGPGVLSARECENELVR